MRTVTPEKIATLCSFIDDASEICIVSHTHPDGDAMGSSLAMKHFISGLFGKKAEVIVPTEWAAQLQFICDCDGVNVFEGHEDVCTGLLGACDLLICLDFNSFSRTGDMEGVMAGFKGRKILIDHHLNPDVSAFDLCFSETEISSASELLYSILMETPAIKGDAGKLPPDCATALMTGMTTDTNNFANSVYPSTLEMASKLLAAGVDRDAIVSHIYNEYGISRVKAMGYLLDRKLKILPTGVAYMILEKEESVALGIKEGDTEAFVNIPLAVREVNYSIFIREDEGYYRVSVRSKKGHSANMLARTYFNGGGHEQAAGGRLYFPSDIADRCLAAEFIEKVTARFLQEQLPSKQ